MGKIGDLWVRLGLKKQDFDSGIRSAEKTVSGLRSTFSKIAKGGALAFGAIGIAATGLIGIIKDLSQQNENLGDSWNRTVSGMSAMWNTLKTDVASMSFRNIINDLSEANRLARDLYDALDALGEINTSHRLSYADQLLEINRLKTTLHNVNLSEDERIEAGKKLKQIYADLAKDPTRGLKAYSDANLNVLADKLGFNLKGASKEYMESARSQVLGFFKWLGTESGEEWNAAYAEAAKDPAKLLGTNMEAQNAGLTNNQRALLYNYQFKVDPETRQKMEDAYVAFKEQEAKATEDSYATDNYINRLEKQKSENRKKAAKEAAEARKKEIRDIKNEAREIAQLSSDVDEYDRSMEEMGNEVAANIAATTMGFPQVSKDIQELRDIADAAIRDLENPAWRLEWEGVFNIGELESMGDELIERLDYMNERAAERAEDFKQAVIDGYVDGIQELTDQLMELEDTNPGRIFQALLSPLADMAIREGEIVMAQGLAIEAVKSALDSLQGVPAILAGASLIAIGSAAKSGLAALAKGGTGTTVQNYGGGSGGYGTGNVVRSELVVKVEGTIKGSDIVISGQNTMNSWGR